MAGWEHLAEDGADQGGAAGFEVARDGLARAAVEGWADLPDDIEPRLVGLTRAGTA